MCAALLAYARSAQRAVHAPVVAPAAKGLEWVLNVAACNASHHRHAVDENSNFRCNACVLASTGVGSMQLSAVRLEEARGAHQRANVMRLAYVPVHSVLDSLACFSTHRPSFLLQGSQVARFRGGSTSPLQSST